MAKNRKPTSLNVSIKAQKIVEKLSEKHGVHKADVVNTMIRVYKSKTERGEWNDEKISEGYHISLDKKDTTYYRLNEELDDWLGETADENGIYKSDLLSRIVMYCMARAKRGDIGEGELI